MSLSSEQVVIYLERLHRAKSTVFGANNHHFLLNSVLSEAEVAAFERLHKVHLPAGYRDFLTLIGNGGAGPSYGIFRMGTMCDPGYDTGSWPDDVGSLSEQFPFEIENGAASTGRSDDLFIVGPKATGFA